MKRYKTVYLISRRYVMINTRQVIVAVNRQYWEMILNAVIPRGLAAEHGRRIVVRHGQVQKTDDCGPGYELSQGFGHKAAYGHATLSLSCVNEFKSHLLTAQEAKELAGIPAEVITEILSLCQTGFEIKCQLEPPAKRERGKQRRHLKVIK